MEACFPWIVSCLYSELPADVCKNPKGQGIVSSLYSERFNGKEENIRVSIFHLEGNGRMLGLGGSFLIGRPLEDWLLQRSDGHFYLACLTVFSSHMLLFPLVLGDAVCVRAW